MKKLSILLMVLVMAGGFAFAADLTVTGSAEVSAVVDLDAPSFDIDNDTAPATDFTLTLSTGSAEKAGSGDIYAEITASASLKVNKAGDDFATTLKIDSAKIYAGDLTVSILGSPKAFSYAFSAWVDANGDSDDDVKSAFGDGEGVTVSYQDFTVGVDFSTVDAWALSVATDLELSDGITVGVGAAFDDASAFALAAKVSAEIEGGSVAAAMDFDGGAIDVSASVDFAPVSVDAYYGNDLEVRSTVDLDPVSLTLTGAELLTNQDLGVSAKTTVDAATITVGGGYVLNGGAWDVNGKVVYAMDMASVTLAGVYDGTLLLDASVTSDSVIDGATVSLAWDSGDLLDSKLGTITAKAVIKL